MIRWGHTRELPFTRRRASTRIEKKKRETSAIAVMVPHACGGSWDFLQKGCPMASLDATPARPPLAALNGRAPGGGRLKAAAVSAGAARPKAASAPPALRGWSDGGEVSKRARSSCDPHINTHTSLQSASRYLGGVLPNVKVVMELVVL